jgi:autotransporter-associated beta strand protein
LLVNGLLSTSSLPSEGAAGGTNSPIGASGNAAKNLVLTGGGLRYTGAGGNTDRLFTVTGTGGTLDASGTGPIVFNNGGQVVSADPAPRATTDSATSPKVTLASVADLVAGMTVTGTNIPAGTTIISINPTASSITLSNTPAAAGADTLSFSTANRMLTLTGTNTGENVMGNSLSDSTGGGTLSLTKSGSGAWSLTASNSYTGLTTVQGGTLAAVGSAAWAPALANSNITGGRLVFDYSSDSSPAGSISTALMNSYGSNFTTGPLRSTAATTTKGLGWKDDTASKKVTVMLTYFGDTNLDGQVTTGDFTTLAQNFNAAGVWANGDFNYDGAVNALDFNALATNFGAAALPATSLGTLVPEPASIGLLLAAPALCMRRWRR